MRSRGRSEVTGTELTDHPTLPGVSPIQPACSPDRRGSNACPGRARISQAWRAPSPAAMSAPQPSVLVKSSARPWNSGRPAAHSMRTQPGAMASAEPARTGPPRAGRPIGGQGEAGAPAHARRSPKAGQSAGREQPERPPTPVNHPKTRPTPGRPINSHSSRLHPSITLPLYCIEFWP